MPRPTRSGSAPTASVTRSARLPAKHSIRGPEHATSSGTLGCVIRSRKRSRLAKPSQSTVPPARYVWTCEVSAAKRSTGIGLRPRWNSAVSPRPMPSTNRPPDASCTVAATLASSAGCRVNALVTAVANRNWSVAAAAMATATNGSPMRFWESVNVMPSQPSCSARTACCTTVAVSGSRADHSSTVTAPNVGLPNE